MDRGIDVRTPESVALTYQLAGIGSRFLALAIDQLVQFGVLALLIWGVIAAAGKIPTGHIAQHPPRVDESVEALAIALVVAVLFALFFGYFIAFETLWSGQTPGKRALGIRVVRDGGYPIDFASSLIRNLIRVGELALGYYLLAALSALISPENKRLGDIAAGTIVVRDAPASFTLDLARVRSEPEYAGTRYLSGEERAIIKRFMERRDVLSPENRQRIAARLAARARPRVPSDLQRLEDEALLERL